MPLTYPQSKTGTIQSAGRLKRFSIGRIAVSGNLAYPDGHFITCYAFTINTLNIRGDASKGHLPREGLLQFFLNSVPQTCAAPVSILPVIYPPHAEPLRPACYQSYSIAPEFTTVIPQSRKSRPLAKPTFWIFQNNIGEGRRDLFSEKP